MATTHEDFDDSVVIRILDHQISDSEGRLVGKVDDLAVRVVGDDLLVEGLMVGPAALAPRYPGAIGRWGWAVWRRLNHPDDPGVVVVPFDEVRELGSQIRVSDRARDALLAESGLENWLRRYLVSRLPWNGGDAEHERARAPHPIDLWHERPPARGSDGPTHRLGELLGMPVHDDEGSFVGRITDLRGRGAPGAAAIRLTRALVGPRLAGSSLGYSSEEQQGPWVIGRVVRAIHRSAHWHELTDLELSWTDRRATRRAGAERG